MKLAYISRSDFLNNHFDFNLGEHINVVCPTGSGKTQLVYQLSEKVIPLHPEAHYVSLMPKGLDETTMRWAPKLGLKTTESWPPSRKLLHGDEPYLHVFWPKNIQNDEKANQAHLHLEFQKAFSDLFWGGESITFADDAYVIGVMYQLNQELDRHWIAGRSHKSSLITTLQKPSGTRAGGVSSFAYDAPTHMFFGRDNDQRNLDRISELGISTLDPRDIQNEIRNLKVHRIGNSAVSEMLYLDRRGPYAAIIGI